MGRLQLRVELEGEWLKKFNSIKERKGLKANTEVIRQLIKEAYDRLQQ